MHNIFSGRWEAYFRWASYWVSWVRASAIRQLFSFDDLEQQSRFVDTVWDTWWLRFLMRIMLSNWMSKWAFGDPGFYQFTDQNMTLGHLFWLVLLVIIPLGDYCYNGMLQTLKTHLAKKNFMFSLLFRGILGEDLPPYLADNYYLPLRASIDCVQSPVKATLAQHMRSIPAGTYSKFSFSDVPSFLPQEGFEEVLDTMIHAARDGARFCIRLFLSSQKIPERFTSKGLPGSQEGYLELDQELAHHLEITDRAFAYRFYVGTVHKL